ncbi:MAG: response regulator transcription factor [Desulfobulbaceae bacterium]|nr:response regulator transcription factor [Desulfobulbaceae bacterium]HIJ78117.1 response regulator transcription factor [Deltaproteobacteria bacterium]
MNQARIVIIDDHLLLLSGLCLLLNGQEDMTVVGQADTIEKAKETVQELSPDIILLDITINDDSGLHLLPNLKAMSPDSKIIILTMHEDQQYLQKAMQLGAAGFVLKKGLDVDLLYAIRSVMRGEAYIQPAMLKTYISGEVEERAAAKPKEKELILWESLSAREKEVMLAVAHGHTSKEIAEKNFLSEKTVATYRSRAMLKLGIETRADLVGLTLRLGFLLNE